MRRVRLGESLVGKVKRLIKKGYERECQSLIGKVQRMVTAGWMTVMAINMCQSLIGKVQQQYLGCLLLLLSTKHLIFAMFF